MKAQDATNGQGWTVYHGDSCEVLQDFPVESIGFSLHSPPYLGLYQYSATPRDISNCRTDEEFWEHYRFVIKELFRLTKPGRIACVDLMNVPAMMVRDGYIGLKDFRGDVIREYIAAGFIWHSEHCVFKDPLIESTRTKALGLMHQQLMKDSSMCRAGIPQYLEAFRKPGKNAEPIKHDEPLKWYGQDEPTTGNLSHERWRRYASPIYMDIDFTNTLNAAAARDDDDERHIAPMSMDLINRAIELWSNPGDVVLDPFNGIGSTGYCALKAKRRYIGIELKKSYYQQAVKNLQSVVAQERQQDLFANVGE
jgi:DNA modification methylase